MKSLLYATDYSDASVAALHLSQVLSKMLNMRLVITHVYDLPTVLGTPLQGPFPNLQTDSRISERQKLMEFYKTRLLKGYRPVDLRIEPVENMSVLSGIISKASEWHARLIVVGMKGESTLKEFVMGSTTKKLFDKAPCPVLSVPASHHISQVHRLVYATDYEMEDLKALEKVVALAAAFDAEIRVVHVASMEEKDDSTRMEWFRELALEKIRYPKLYFERIHSNDVMHTLQDYTRILHADLIGMLEREPKGGVAKWFHRDLVKQMASQSSIPLLSFNEQNLQTLFF